MSVFKSTAAPKRAGSRMALTSRKERQSTEMERSEKKDLGCETTHRVRNSNTR